MGKIRMGPPKEFVLLLKEAANLTTFVETGTFYGDTAAWAADHFNQVWTVEGSTELHRKAQERYGKYKNLHFLCGDSREALGEQRFKSALYWLDAHWCGPDTFGRQEQCPLIEELTLIFEGEPNPILLIDDARLFTSPPPPPNQASQWPDLKTVLDTLHVGRTERFTVIIEDVIVSVPAIQRALVVDYCRKVSARNLAAEEKRRTQPDWMRGLKMAATDLRRKTKGKLARWLTSETHR